MLKTTQLCNSISTAAEHGVFIWFRKCESTTKLKRANSSLKVLFTPFASINSRADYFHCFQLFAVWFGASEPPFVFFFDRLCVCNNVLCICLCDVLHVLISNGSQKNIHFFLGIIKYWSFPWTEQTPVYCISTVRQVYLARYLFYIYLSLLCRHITIIIDENRCRFSQYTQVDSQPMQPKVQYTKPAIDNSSWGINSGETQITT